jgi:hypothetical protein
MGKHLSTGLKLPLRLGNGGTKSMILQLLINVLEMLWILPKAPFVTFARALA